MKQSLFDILSNVDESQRYTVLSRYVDYSMAKKRIPYYASLEITPICNLNCQMCYIRMSPKELEDSNHELLVFNDWKYYIDGLCDIGTDNFILTGGECMTHPDFIQIYEYIYDLGKAVSMITNASCLTKKILDTFVLKPPNNIFITLYGSSTEVYERFCKNGEAFNSVKRNIDTLINHKMPVRFMCTIGKGNEDDTDNIRAFGEKRGIKVQVGGDLISFDKCDDKKLSNAQIDIFSKRKEEFEKTNNNSSLNDFYKEYVFPNIDEKNVHKNGIDCAAAKHICSISWRGTMRPCVTFEPFNLDPRKDGGIKKAWDKIVEWGNTVPQIIECQTCLFRKECMPCLARHYNEIHEYGKVSPKHCFKIQHPEEAAKLQAEYDRRQALKEAGETE